MACIALRGKRNTVTVIAERLQPKPAGDVYRSRSASASVALIQGRMKARRACNCGGNDVVNRVWRHSSPPPSFPPLPPYCYPTVVSKLLQFCVLLIQFHYETVLRESQCATYRVVVIIFTNNRENGAIVQVVCVKDSLLLPTMLFIINFSWQLRSHKSKQFVLLRK